MAPSTETSVEEPVPGHKNTCFSRSFCNINAFTVLFSVAAMFTSCMNTYIVSQVTTLEKVLGISSKKSGFMLASPEIGFLSVVILSSHISRKFHIPRVVSLLTLGYGILVIVCVIPHLMMLAYPGVFYTESDKEDNYTEPLTPLCGNNSTSTQDNVAEVSKISNSLQSDGNDKLRKRIQYISFAMITTSLVFQGAIKAPRIPLMSAFIDDHVSKTKTGIYFSAVVAIGIIGSLVAVGLGSVTSRLYATLQVPLISRQNPLWMGAWWMGFVIVAVVSVAVALPLALFRRRFESYRHKLEEEKDKLAKTTLKSEIKDFPRAICQLIRNPVYCTIILGNCFNALGVTGRISYLPKYIEVHFRQTSSNATLYFGVSTLAGAFIGVLTGGIVLSKFKMSAKSALRFGVIVGFVALGLLVPSSLLACSQPRFNGFDLYRLKHPAKPKSLTTAMVTCYSNCSCQVGDYFPVCGSDGKDYFSPCFAGCTKGNDSTHVFSNCACVPDDGHVVPGLCNTNCETMIPFLVLEFAAALLWLSTLIPKTVVQLRCVNIEDRSLSMGAGSFMHTIFGLISPIIFGALIDSSCLLWNSRYCKLYDVTELRRKYLFTSFGSCAISAVLYAISLAIVMYSDKYKNIMESDYEALISGDTHDIQKNENADENNQTKNNDTIDIAPEFSINSLNGSTSNMHNSGIEFNAETT